MKNDRLCDEFKLGVAVSSLSALIASKFDNNDELALIAALLTQTGDNLASIIVRRDLCERNENE